MLLSSSAGLANENGDDISIIEDSNTKKVYFKDLDATLDDVMVVDPLPVPSLSWKGMLVGKETLDQSNKNGDQLFDNSLSLTEQDVKKSIVNGRNLGITTLHNKLYGIWKPSKLFQLMDIENGYFLAKFQNTVDYDKILSQGPWVIFGHYLTVQSWSIDFNPNLPYPNLVLTWIHFPGKVTKLDFNMDSRARGRYARMTVFVNLGRPLISKILISGSPQRIEYENLPVVCFKCGFYGHTEENENMEGEYEPWMLVERKTRRVNMEGAKKENNLKRGKYWDYAQKGLARASKPSSGKAVQSVSETKMGLDTPVDLGENNSIPLASNEPVHGQMRGGSQKQAQGSDEHAADPFKYPIALHNSLLNVEEISRQFIPAFKDNYFVNVEVKQGVLEAKNHLAVVFNNKRPLETMVEDLGGSHSASSNLINEGFKNQIAKGASSKGDLSRHQGEEVEFHSSDHQ
ncbi:hypothetical protein GOBAR_AA19330 [Gossypium barbadense]|uniref:DUF4283 domain-containing protein n=1 Tax=Gossypium barbadense TaxID=3634 RepID=A0A2P5XDB1_GOSBA|nr:hypothetical protein GOBAR_AA19330 [Gossypium barbadense]